MEMEYELLNFWASVNTLQKLGRSVKTVSQRKIDEIQNCC